jgi:hypothetical protein
MHDCQRYDIRTDMDWSKVLDCREENVDRIRSPQPWGVGAALTSQFRFPSNHRDINLHTSILYFILTHLTLLTVGETQMIRWRLGSDRRESGHSHLAQSNQRNFLEFCTENVFTSFVRWNYKKISTDTFCTRTMPVCDLKVNLYPRIPRLLRGWKPPADVRRRS